MMRAVDDFRLIAACIAKDAGASSPGELGGRIERASGRWPELLALAHRFYIAPELHHALARKGLLDHVPDEPRELLVMTHALNVKRNDLIRAQCEELIAALDGRGIATVLLKGGAWLFDVAEAERGRRMMRDIDVLVPGDALMDAVAALADIGYSEHIDWPDWTYQYPPLSREDDPSTVELHRDLGEQRALLPADEVFVQAVAAGSGAALPSPTHRTLYNVYNSEILDSHYEVGIASLRQLHDLRLIVERHGDAIDWGWIAARMDANGHGRVLDCYVYLLDKLLGVTLPHSPREPARCRRHYGRCLAQLAWRPLMILPVVWATLIHPVKRRRLDYFAESGKGGAPSDGGGLRRIRHLFGRDRLSVFRKFAETYRKYDREW
jgi:hypothetical protein